MNLGELQRLASLSGFPLLDATAQATGQSPLPSKAAKRLTSLQPNSLDSLTGKWKDTANRLTDHMNELQQSVATILSNWNAPDSFDQYSSEMHQALDHQRTVMNDLNGVIDSLKSALSTAKQDTFDRVELVAAALIGIILAALASVAIAIFTAGTATAACVGAIIALIMALIAFLAAREKSLHNEAKTLRSQMNQVNNMLKGQKLREVTPPMPPSINWDGYHSIHEPIPTVDGRG